MIIHIFSLSLLTEHFAEAVKARQGPRSIDDCQDLERVSEDIQEPFGPLDIYWAIQAWLDSIDEHH